MAKKLSKNPKRKQGQRRKLELIRIVEYMVSGGVWFWSGYILIVLLDDRLIASYGKDKGLFIANFIGNAVGITLNFILERYWVFRTKRQTNLFVATRRYIIYTTLNAFLLNFYILKVLSDHGIDPKIGQLIAAAFFTVWNYFWYKAYVFKGLDSAPRKTKHHA